MDGLFQQHVRGNRMRQRRDSISNAHRFAAVALALAFAGCTTPTTHPQAPQVSTPTSTLEVPLEYYKLPNGLRVVISPEHSVPVATVAVYYHVGFRIEPRDRTGFAHLFEHMMFQGSQNLGKAEFFKLVQGIGGELNGSTRFDYTNYYEAFPSNALQTMLWAEADRMRSLDISEENLTNQKGVVSEEVKVNVLNRPYGGFPWLTLPQYANQNWYNAHNFYGDLKDIEAAKLDEVRDFFNTYYAPGNAVLVVAGDIDSSQTRAWVQQYFGSIAARPTPAPPDISEPAQVAERHAEDKDPLAPRPALAIGYHEPQRWTPEFFAMGLIDQILLQGRDSRLHRDLVEQRGYTDEVFGGMNLMGSMFSYEGPMLWNLGMIHDPSVTDATIVAAIDENISRLQRERVSPQEIERARTKIRSDLYNVIGASDRLGLVELLACFALFDDDPGRVNQIDRQFAAVTPELIMRTAQQYLKPANRTVMSVIPGDTGAAQEHAQ
jgi:zinc protease